MSIIYTQYIVPCVTEGIGITTDFTETYPTVCPHNNTHEIDASGIRVVDKMSNQIMTLKQQNLVTNELFRTDFYSIDAPANTVTTRDITYPYNIDVYLATYLATEANIGDTLEIVAYPNTTCGVLSADLNIGATTLNYVGPNTPLCPGFYLSVTDGVNTNALGEVTSLNMNTKTVTFSTAATNDFLAGTLIKFTVSRLRNVKFVNGNNIVIGTSKLSASGLPAGKVMRYIYTNNSNVDKTLNFYIEIAY